MSNAWMTAAEAARALRVTRSTLYAYVSRGYIRSEPAPGRTRARRYAREDVERVRRRAEERRDPTRATQRALQWGLPVLESGITLVADGRLYYRGHDAIALARERSVTDVASLIWGAGLAAPSQHVASATPPPAASSRRRAGGSFIARAQTMLAAAPTADPAAFDLRPESAARTGMRILALLVRAAVGRSARGTVDEQLAAGWRAGRAAAPVMRATLILCADHELNVSAFTARCVASAGATPYAVVLAALSALGGTRHGGATVRAAAFLASLRRSRNVRTALRDRLRAGEALPGFGHPLYPRGDPRAAEIFRMLREHGASAELAFATRVADAGERLLGERPNLDFALATLERVLRLPQGAGLALFAIGRSIGWIGHAIEQYATGQLIRPRARYVGAVPGEPGGVAGT
ncbi:MAG TPA: citrate synthase family protein [Gemmatimonadaceae bacterium]|nr:citrate synthase family protein [Gemmatimonadaceae bacterium]